MDIADLSPRACGERCVLRHPVTREPLTDDAGNETAVHLAGSDSEQWRDAKRAILDKQLRTKAVARTAESLLEDELDLLVSVTLKFENLIWNGEALQATPANARMLYTKVPWLKEQVDAFNGNRENFYRPS